MELDRFVSAQQPVYGRVRAELRDGTKLSHWMWYIFPQVAGLGQSPMSQYYSLRDIGEAQAYLAHPILGPRLAECTDLMLGWAGRRSAQTILGTIDAMKFESSMTLFEAAGGGKRFSDALDRFFGGLRDDLTLSLLGTIRAEA